MNVASLLDRNPNPDGVALVDRSRQPASEISVSQITNDVRVFAQALIDMGIPAGSRVGLLAGNLGGTTP